MYQKGEVFVNGKGCSGQLGLGPDIEYMYNPHPIKTLQDAGIVDISTGFTHSAAIDADGRVWTWGCNANGALGRDGDPWTPAPVVELDGIRIAAVSCGWSFTIALSSDGHLYGWGGFMTEESIATSVAEAIPTCIDQKFDLQEGETFIAIATGISHAMAQTTEQVFTWGHGQHFQLGRNVSRHPETGFTPTSIGIKNVRYISSGWFCSFVITIDGVVYAWGYNEYGQTGIYPYTSRFVKLPTPVATLRGNIKQIAAARAHTYVLFENGTTTALGRAPASLPPLVRYITTSDRRALAIAEDGQVFQQIDRSAWRRTDHSAEVLAVATALDFSLVLSKPPPPRMLLVLDLNGVLFCKTRVQTYPRPSLHAFLKYVLAHFDVMVWSSAQPHTVARMVDLFGDFKERLVAVWARDKFGLTADQYNSKFPTIKDLSRIWNDDTFNGKYNQYNTILLDDSAEKAQMYLHNAIHPLSFDLLQIERPDHELDHVIKYLDILRKETDVPSYISQHPFVASTY